MLEILEWVLGVFVFVVIVYVIFVLTRDTE